MKKFLSIRQYRNRIEKLLELKKPNPSVMKDKDIRVPWSCVGRRKLSSSVVEIGYEYPIGMSFKDIQDLLEDITAVCGTIVELEDKVGGVVIRIYRDDFPSQIEWDDSMLEMIGDNDLLMGFTRDMKPVTHSYGNNPHIVIAGMSGYGKTDLIRLIVYMLLSKHKVEDLEINVVDMKGYSFLPHKGLNIPNVDIAWNLESALEMIKDVHDELMKRAQMVWDAGSRDVIKSFKRLYLIVDEAAQLSPDQYSNKKMKKLAQECDEYLVRIALLGRENKVGLVYATQRPDANTLNPQIKSVMEASLAFRCKTISNSMVILDRGGAEKLPAKKAGRAIYSATTDALVQVPFVGSDNDWRKLLEPFRRNKQEPLKDGGDDDGSSVGTAAEDSSEQGDEETDDIGSLETVASNVNITDYSTPLLKWRFPTEASVRVDVRTRN